MQTYLREAETLRVIDVIGASLYRWLDETKFSSSIPTYDYARPDGVTVTITHDQYTVLMEGGYYTPLAKCEELQHTEGMVAAVAYVAYARFIVNNPINATAFGAVYKSGEFSSRVDDSALVRNSNEARKIGEAYLAKVVEHCKVLGLLGCYKEYNEDSPGIMIVGGGKM